MKKLTKTLLTLGGMVTVVVLWATPALTQPDPSCYMVNQSGQVIDLSSICHQRVSWSNQTRETDSNQTSRDSYCDVQKWDAPP